MTWFKVDDGLPTHRKVLALPRGARRLSAIGAWTLLGAWCAANQTEGVVPASVIAEFGIPSKAIDDLIRVRLLETLDGGYLVHDYLDYNPSAEQVAADKAAARERQRRARVKSRESRASHAVTDAVSHGEQTPLVTVPPSRPVLNNEPNGSLTTHDDRRRGSRLPDDWRPSPELVAEMRDEGIPDDLARRELPRFCDYWRSIPGAKGRKLDWSLTWRNWLRRANDESPIPNQRASGDPATAWMRGDV